jgi:hypothetical protein
VVYLKLVDVKAAREVRTTVMALGGEHAGPAEAHAAATRLLAPGRFVGTLQVRASIAGASIFIDGELLGRTPARPIVLPVGAHALRVTHPESRDFVRFVEVTFEGTTAVDFTMLPYAALAGDIRRTARDEPVGPGAGPGPTPWYRRWYTVAGGSAILLLGSAIIVGALSGGIDADHEKQLP